MDCFVYGALGAIIVIVMVVLFVLGISVLRALWSEDLVTPIGRKGTGRSFPDFVGEQPHSDTLPEYYTAAEFAWVVQQRLSENEHRWLRFYREGYRASFPQMKDEQWRHDVTALLEKSPMVKRMEWLPPDDLDSWTFDVYKPERTDGLQS